VQLNTDEYLKCRVVDRNFENGKVYPKKDNTRELKHRIQRRQETNLREDLFWLPLAWVKLRKRKKLEDVKATYLFHSRSCKRRGTLFISLLIWLAVEVLSPC